jgi:putative DNA primase/helicase
MTSYPNRAPGMLSDSHRRMLFEGSGISPEVATERGYRTVKRRAELEEFPAWQRRLGLYVPMYSPDGTTRGCQIRPDRPRKPNLKYESPQGSRVIIDVHPRMLKEVRHGDGDLWVVEGTKKADALVSRGEGAIALAGVWMAHVPKSKPKKLLPCWDYIRLADRRVFVAFDSDWRRKVDVHDALEWLVGALEDRGADVRVAYLEDDPVGSKVGVDDFLVGGVA